MIKYKGKVYRIDMERLFALICTKNEGSFAQQEIVDSYNYMGASEGYTAQDKQVRNVVSGVDTSGMRYDTYRAFIDIVLEADAELFNTIGYVIAFNTLLDSKILVEENGNGKQ